MIWKRIISDEVVYEQVKNKINEIYTEVIKKEVCNYYGLLGGYSGVLLFLYYYYKFTKNEDVLNKLHSFFNSVYSNFYKEGIGTFCNGYSGICWLIRFLHKEGVIESDNIDKHLEKIDEINLKYISYYIENCDYD